MKKSRSRKRRSSRFAAACGRAKAPDLCRQHGVSETTLQVEGEVRRAAGV